MLVKCKDCGEPIALDANRCPHCGGVNNLIAGDKMVFVAKILFIVSFLFNPFGFTSIITFVFSLIALILRPIKNSSFGWAITLLILSIIGAFLGICITISTESYFGGLSFLSEMLF